MVMALVVISPVTGRVITHAVIFVHRGLSTTVVPAFRWFGVPH